MFRLLLDRLFTLDYAIHPNPIKGLALKSAFIDSSFNLHLQFRLAFQTSPSLSFSLSLSLFSSNPFLFVFVISALKHFASRASCSDFRSFVPLLLCCLCVTNAMTKRLSQQTLCLLSPLFAFLFGRLISSFHGFPFDSESATSKHSTVIESPKAQLNQLIDDLV
jgi:hypothetical protein